MILISPKHITGNFNISSAKKNISSFISETNQITHTIFKETLPHLIAMSPWNVSKTTSMRGVILPFMLVSHAYLTNIKEFLGQRKRPANNYFKESLCLNPGCRTLIEANEAIHKKITKFSQTYLHSKSTLVQGTTGVALPLIALNWTGLSIPRIFGWQIGINGIALMASSVGAWYAIKEGVSKLIEEYRSPSSERNQKISKIASGILLTTLGLWALASMIQNIKNLKESIPLFEQATDLQKEGILKFGAISTLYEKKSCNAVIIDGLSSKWGEWRDDIIVFPFNELLYQKCKTLYYRVNSALDFQNALSSASKYFQAKVDVLAISAHSTFQKMHLGPNYDFGLHPNRKIELSSLNKYLSKTAQLFLCGCNTATETVPGIAPLAEKISKKLQGREVTGFAAFFYPLFMSTSYQDGRFSIEHLCPNPKKETINGNAPTSFFNTIRYLNGKKINK